MAGVRYQAGTVYVDVVPSMGFSRASRTRRATQLPQVAGDAGKKYAEKFREQVSVGKAIVDAIADPLRPRRGCARRPPRPGRHCKRRTPLSKCPRRRAVARGEEETAATAVERARRACKPAAARALAHPLTRRLLVGAGGCAGLGARGIGGQQRAADQASG